MSRSETLDGDTSRYLQRDTAIELLDLYRLHHSRRMQRPLFQAPEADFRRKEVSRCPVTPIWLARWLRQMPRPSVFVALFVEQIWTELEACDCRIAEPRL